MFFISSCKKDVANIISDGNMKYHHNDYQGALQDFNRVIELMPHNSQAYLLCGQVKYALKDYSGAILDYNHVYANDYAFMYRDRGNARKKLGDYLGAIQDYNKFLDIFPIYSEAYYNRAAAKQSLNDSIGAKQDFAIAKELFDDYLPTTNYYGGRLQLESKDYIGSVHDFDIAIDTNPNDDSSYYYRGYAKLGLGDKSGACSDWNKAASLGINHAKDLIKQYCK